MQWSPGRSWSSYYEFCPLQGMPSYPATFFAYTSSVAEVLLRSDFECPGSSQGHSFYREKSETWIGSSIKREHWTSTNESHRIGVNVVLGYFSDFSHRCDGVRNQNKCLGEHPGLVVDGAS